MSSTRERTLFEFKQLKEKIEAIEILVNSQEEDFDYELRVFSLINEMNYAYNRCYRSAYISHTDAYK